MSDDRPITADLQALRTIHYALILSPLLFSLGVVFFFEDMAGGEAPTEDAALAGQVLLGVAALNTLGAGLLRPRLFRRVGGSRSEAGGLAAYRAGVILFCALLESAALLLLVGALLTASLMPFVPAVLVPMALGLANPPSERHYRELRGDQSE